MKWYYFGTDWTPELKQAWTDAYEAVVDMMLSGANYLKVPSSENAIGQHDKQAESNKAPMLAPSTSSVNYSPEISSLENRSQPSDKQAESNKAPRLAPTTSGVNYSPEISSLENRSQPSDKQAQSNKAPTKTTDNTSIMNLKLLVVISVIAGLLGVGFLYYHYNSKQDKDSFTSSVAKTT